jgi:hypothetical protein
LDDFTGSLDDFTGSLDDFTGSLDDFTGFLYLQNNLSYCNEVFEIYAMLLIMLT